MNKRILRLAIPNIISNVVVPLIGLVDIALAGRLNYDSAIGGIAIGTSILGFVYWNFSFLRMGTSGLTAQAYGARNLSECSNILLRSLIVAVASGLLLILFQKPIGNLGMRLMQGSDEVMEQVALYFYARIWAAPATISLFAVSGWFIGMQNSRLPMIIAVAQNIVNIVVSVWFIFGLGWGVAGIGWGTVVTQYFGLAMAAVMWIRYYSRLGKYVDFKRVFSMELIAKFFHVNKDIFVRNAVNTFVYTFITAASARFGDTVLATNSVLMQLLLCYTYMLDGFAFAAESLVGRFKGANNFPAMKQAVKYLFVWCFVFGLFFVVVYLVGWREILSVFTKSKAIQECARQFIVWIALVPIVGFAPFLMDGMMLGATQTKVLRNSMLLSGVVFFALFYAFVGVLGNSALWLAYVVYIAVRGVLQYFMSDRLKGYVWQ